MKTIGANEVAGDIGAWSPPGHRDEVRAGAPRRTIPRATFAREMAHRVRRKSKNTKGGRGEVVNPAAAGAERLPAGAGRVPSVAGCLSSQRPRPRPHTP